MANSVTKTRLLKLISDSLGDSVSQKQVGAVFDELVAQIIELTSKSRKIHLNNLGRFEVKVGKPHSIKAHFQDGKPVSETGGGPKLKFKSFDNVNRQIAERWNKPPKRRRGSHLEAVEGLFHLDEDD